jgi:hypothetical protein
LTDLKWPSIFLLFYPCPKRRKEKNRTVPFSGLFPLGFRVKTGGFFECVKVELKGMPKKLALEIWNQFEKYPGGIKCV